MMKHDTEDGGARPRRRGWLPEALVTDTRNYGDGYPKRRGWLPEASGKFARHSRASLPKGLKKSWACKLLVVNGGVLGCQWLCA